MGNCLNRKNRVIPLVGGVPIAPVTEFHDIRPVIGWNKEDIIHKPKPVKKAYIK